MICLTKVVKLGLLIGYIWWFSFLAFVPASAQESPAKDEHVTTPFIKRDSYAIASVGANSVGAKKGGKAKSQGGSIFPFSNSTTGILSAAGTVLSVAAGGIFTWLKIKKRNSVFNSYLKEIEAQKSQFFTSIKSDPNSKEKLLDSLQEALKKIQESAELSTADKKIEESQLTVISHKIESVINELSPHAVK